MDLYEFKKYKDIDITAPPPETEPERQYWFIKKLGQKAEEFREKKGRNIRFFIQTFGCQMNERDSEKMAGTLEASGFEACDEEEKADVILYNTCTVRDNADQRVFGRLGVLKGLKDKNPELLICLSGCMMQEASVIEKIRGSYPHVDLIFGTHNIYKLAELLNETISSGSMVIDIWEHEKEIVEELPSDRKYPFKSGVNIMFGCNNFCSYCIVPYVRGRERSREPKDIIREIEALVRDGVKEVMLLGQNVNSYGKGLDPYVSFPELLKEISVLEGLERIRFMSSHPKDLSDDLIEVMASSPKICSHLHLALQSGSSRVLKDMNRHYGREDYLTIINKLRARMPDIAITTDIIVGFPTETKEDVEETIEVIKEARFDGAFTFIYSKRTGTPAAKMDFKMSDGEIHECFDRVLKTVQDTARDSISRFVGRTLPVLVEDVNEKDDTMLTGRIPQNTVVHFKGDRSLIGKIVNVHLDEALGFYYMGTIQ
ncbi:MAG: tRNA (N6-isopentenyl adenosine(37)-C2)-methylthiotransferase MiaB [Lachnospiraceae bacterium]|nr:tRNA (N6-isopentenyl adenosine(37)-C2)-methylthiotransferase MiaB [Lachnospiraceae bacterium]